MCKTLVTLTEFTQFKHSNGKYYYNSRCRTCGAKQRRKRMQDPAAKAVRKAWDQSDTGKASAKKGNQSEAGKVRQSRANKSEKGRARKKRFRGTEHGKEYDRTLKRKKREECPGQKVQDAISATLTKLLAGRKLTSSKLQLTGLDSREELMAYLLDTAHDKRMTKDNYGVNGWELDHKIPKIEYDHSDDEDTQRCWNWRNLRAEWYSPNRSKGATVLQSMVDTVPKEFWPKKWAGVCPV